MQGLSLVVASGDHSSSWCAGLSLSRPLLLQSTGSRCAGSVVVAHGPSCSAACGIFPEQGSNPCPRHWQADSQPLRHQGSPVSLYLKVKLFWRNVVWFCSLIHSDKLFPLIEVFNTLIHLLHWHLTKLLMIEWVYFIVCFWFVTSVFFCFCLLCCCHSSVLPLLP